MLRVLPTSYFQNATSSVRSSCSQLSGLVSLGALPALCSLLECAEADLLLTACEALSAALAAAEATSPAPNPCAILIEEAGGCEKLEALQMHENSAVYERAARILDEYYGEGDAEDAAIAPQSTADGYSFGVSPR